MVQEIREGRYLSREIMEQIRFIEELRYNIDEVFCQQCYEEHEKLTLLQAAHRLKEVRLLLEKAREVLSCAEDDLLKLKKLSENEQIIY